MCPVECAVAELEGSSSWRVKIGESKQILMQLTKDLTWRQAFYNFQTMNCLSYNLKSDLVETMIVI